MYCISLAVCARKKWLSYYHPWIIGKIFSKTTRICLQPLYSNWGNLQDISLNCLKNNVLICPADFISFLSFHRTSPPGQTKSNNSKRGLSLKKSEFIFIFWTVCETYWTVRIHYHKSHQTFALTYLANISFYRCCSKKNFHSSSSCNKILVGSLTHNLLAVTIGISFLHMWRFPYWSCIFFSSLYAGLQEYEETRACQHPHLPPERQGNPGNWFHVWHSSWAMSSRQRRQGELDIPSSCIYLMNMSGFKAEWTQKETCPSVTMSL